jgi:hypothetical protein
MIGSVRMLIEMRKLLALVPLLCVPTSASLILTISDPNQTVAPGAHAIYHATLLNTDFVTYNIVNFPMINPPTDSPFPPTTFFPLAAPAVPFLIGPGALITGLVFDFTVPTAALIRDHPFGIQAATDVLGTGGSTIVSNVALADLNVAVPEPRSTSLICLAFVGLGLVRFLKRLAFRQLTPTNTCH